MTEGFTLIEVLLTLGIMAEARELSLYRSEHPIPPADEAEKR